MQLKEVYEILCELYDAAREFIETYVIEDYQELAEIHRVKSFAIEYVI
jgi:hypothetical protein